jgi:hypothetical protein
MQDITTTVTNVPTIHTIKMKLNNTLDYCLPLFNIGKGVEKNIRKKMLNIIKSNKEIGRLKNTEAVVFTLLVYAIKELKIPLNKSKLNAKIKSYISMNVILKDLQHLEI